jgi:hypothetical protein
MNNIKWARSDSTYNLEGANENTAAGEASLQEPLLLPLLLLRILQLTLIMLMVANHSKKQQQQQQRRQIGIACTASYSNSAEHGHFRVPGSVGSTHKLSSG